MKKMKKGFTIVELVIVIAVIAILAGVLIPVFSNVVDKANKSKDTQLVRNLNEALAVDMDEHNTMYDALQAAKEFGYDVGKINASATDNEILWDSENDCFVYLNDGKLEYIPNTKHVEIAEDDYHKLWKIVDSVPETQTYSLYAGNGFTATDVEVKVGFDAGENDDIATVTYTGAKEVTIRTNGGTLVVNNGSASVNHYGTSEVVDVLKAAGQSYHLFGQVGFLKVTEGRVVAEQGAEIKGLHIANDAAKVVINTEAVVEKVTASAGVTIDNTKVEGINSADVVLNVDPEKAQSGSELFAGGFGESYAPYIIKTAEQLQNIGKNLENYAYYKVADGVESLDCSNWPVVRLNGSFNGNGVKLLNLSAALFESVGYNNANGTIVIENFVADMYNTTGRALVRNIYNSGTTTFRNISLHGYVEGQYNMGSFYNYGTANLGGSDGADYTVEFENATSDLTLVCTTGNAIGGMLGHGFEGADYKLSINMDEKSGYTGKMYTTGTATCYQVMAMCSHATYTLNGVETSRYDNKYSSMKIATADPTKTENIISIGLVDGASSLQISINVQITAYDKDGNKIDNAAGMTWVADQYTVGGIVGEEKAVVFDKVYTDATIVNDVNLERGIKVDENGVLTLSTGSSMDYQTGTIKLFVIQYDAQGNILAVGSITLAYRADNLQSDWVINN